VVLDARVAGRCAPEAEVGIRAGRGRRFDSADGMFAELDGVRREPDGGDRG
jgi:hypothetical protein